MLEGENIKW